MQRLTYQLTAVAGLLVLATGAIVLFSTSVSGQGGAPAPPQYKIGIVDLRVVFESYQKQKDSYKELESEKDTRQKDIDKLSQKITELQNKYKAEKDKMSREEASKLEEQIESEVAFYQTEFRRLQQEIDRKEARLADAVFKDIRDAVNELGAKENYHIILEGGKTGTSGVLYSSPTLNLTQKVVDELNAKYKKP